MFGFVRGVRGRAVAVVLVVAGLLGGVTASSVAAAISTTVTWNVSSLTAGQVKILSNVATTNSPGVKTWSKTGSCTLSPTSKPTTLTMGSTGSCTLTLNIAKSGNYLAKTSTKIITQKPCANGGVCAVGDRGPGGGIIFYKDLTRAAGSQYFEAACAGWSDGTCGGSDLTDPTAVWGCFGTLIAGADGRAMGTGEQNTKDIVTGCTTAGIAAKVAKALVLGGQSDWFLPSKNELNQMYIRRTAIGGFSPDVYGSSSEESSPGSVDINYAWVQYFSIGFQEWYRLNFTFYVRPVRAF
jgi:hypothetical protein